MSDSVCNKFVINLDFTEKKKKMSFFFRTLVFPLQIRDYEKKKKKVFCYITIFITNK